MSAARTCPRCGEENPERARFCLACGAPIDEPAGPRRQVRKTVTVLFADVTGSTDLGERLDPEALRRVMGAYFEEMRIVLEAHGGTVEKFIGDAIMAVFGIPLSHEDDALRAVRAAMEMQQALALLNEELERQHGIRIRVRTGINTGEVVSGDTGASEHLVTGDAVNTAARLEQAAGPDEILLGATTYGLVRDAVEVDESALSLQVKGKAAPVLAHRLRSVKADATAVTRRLESPLVGRDQELAALSQALDRSISGQTTQLFTVLGSAGVGKSRLVYELLQSASSRVRIIRGRCLPYGSGITFWPLAEALKGVAGIQESDDASTAMDRLASMLRTHGETDERIVERLGVALGFIKGVAPAEELSWAVRRTFEALAREQPLIAVFDDLQWAEPTFLDVLEHVVDWSRDASILVVCLARAELLEQRPSWGGGKVNATVILLEGLAEEHSVSLAERLLGSGESEMALAPRIADAAEGNPLFVEQMVGMLVDDGLLVPVDGRYQVMGSIEHVRVPPTVSALLQARLDRLTDGERDVLGRAAVVGKEFQRSAVHELSPPPARANVAERLLHLVRKELIRPQRAPDPGDELFRFRHLLIRDSAYASMPKEERADLHERFGHWLTAWAGMRLAEYEEIVAYHFEQAYGYRRELGPPDQRVTALGREAARLLDAAGQRALARNDWPAALGLLSRATDLLPEADSRRLELLIELGETTYIVGDLARAHAVTEEALTLGRQLGDRRIEALARAQRAQLLMTTDPAAEISELEDAIEAAEPIIETDDAFGVLRLLLARYELQTIKCRWSEAGAIAAEARAVALRVGDLRFVVGMARGELNAMHWGATPAPEAIARGEALRDALDIEGVGRALGEMLAPLYAMQGESERARASYGEALRYYDEMGMKGRRAYSSLRVWDTERVCGDTVAAVRAARDGVDRTGKLEETGVRSTLAGMLADSLCELGRLAEADEASVLAEKLGSSGDLSTQILWRTARAKVRTRQGALDEARSLAESAIGIASTTDFLTLQALAFKSLGEVELISGRTDEAIGALRQALERFESKGDLPDAERTRALIDSLTLDAEARG